MILMQIRAHHDDICISRTLKELYYNFGASAGKFKSFKKRSKSIEKILQNLGQLREHSTNVKNMMREIPKASDTF